MDSYIIREKLLELENKEISNPRKETGPLLAHVSDLLNLLLAEDSSILREFEKCKQEYFELSEIDFAKAQISPLLACARELCKAAREQSELEDNLDRERWGRLRRWFWAPSARRRRRAGTAPRHESLEPKSRLITSDLHESLEREARLIMTDRFPRHPWIIASGLVLLVSAGFLVGGTIQIRNVTLDINKRVQATLKRVEVDEKKALADIKIAQGAAKTEIMNTQGAAKTEIMNTQGAALIDIKKVWGAAEVKINDGANIVEQELQQYFNQKKDIIDKKINDHLKTIQPDKPPDLIAFLKRVNVSAQHLEQGIARDNKKLQNLETRIYPLEEAFRSVPSLNEGMVERLEKLLHRSRLVLGIEAFLISAAFLLSLVAVILSRRRRPT